MDIDIKEVIDYCRCPMYYKFKYKDEKFKTETINVLEKYETDIHKTIYSFFSSVQHNEPAGIGILKKTWGQLWIGSKSGSDLMYSTPSSWRDTHNEKRKRGIDTLVNFVKAIGDKPGFPIVVNQKYRVNLGGKLFLTGAFEVVREIKEGENKIIEIIDFKVDDKLHNKLYIEKDLEMTATSYAFRNVFGIDEDRILYYGLDKNNKSYTFRNEDDYKMLFHTVKCVASAIYNKLFYACPDGDCYSCPYKNICVDSLTYENML